MVRKGDVLPAKTCRACAALLVQRATERIYDFAKRITCGHACATTMLHARWNRPLTAAPYRRVGVGGGKSRQVSRVLVEQLVGRTLCRDEHVHHINGNKTDDRLENLRVMSAGEHAALHSRKHPTEKTCVMCGATFTPAPSKRLRAKTCGPACARALASVNQTKVWASRRSDQ